MLLVLLKNVYMVVMSERCIGRYVGINETEKTAPFRTPKYIVVFWSFTVGVFPLKPKSSEFYWVGRALLVSPYISFLTATGLNKKNTFINILL